MTFSTTLTSGIAYDGWVFASNSTYATARSGPATGATTSGAIFVGQQLATGTYLVTQGYIAFDVSALTGATLATVTLKLYGASDSSTTDFVIEAREYDFGTSLGNADYVAGASLGDYPLCAELNTSAFATSVTNTFTSYDALLTAITNALAGDGILRLHLSSKRQRDNTAPSGNEFVSVASSDAASSSQRPQLTVTYSYTLPGGAGVLAPPAARRRTPASSVARSGGRQYTQPLALADEALAEDAIADVEYPEATNLPAPTVSRRRMPPLAVRQR